MGPFTSTHFILKTGISAGCRPTTSKNIRVPFPLLCQSLRCFRGAGFGVEAIHADPSGPQVTQPTPEKKTATKAAKPAATKKADPAPAKQAKPAGRRGRRKAS